MRRLFIFTAILLTSFTVYAQDINNRGEFANNSNGLMYSDADIKALRFVVDSLNLKFKTCDLSQNYYSLSQAKFYQVHFVSDTNNLKSIIDDLDKISFIELVTKYNSFLQSQDTSSLFISGKDHYLSGNPSRGYQSFSLTGDRNNLPKIIPGKWTFRYDVPQTYDKHYRLSCYFFPEQFRSVAIPKEYAMLIQYVDCMVDTSSVIFKAMEKQETDNTEYKESFEKVNDYLNTSMKLKNKGDDRWEFNIISDRKSEFAIEKLRKDDYFKRLVEELAEQCILTANGSDGIEKLVAAFVSKEQALLLKRNRRVVGRCSMDQSPRIHAKNIAVLAAEAHSWNIFLRAHLDIMNDRFDRASDGSYAWGGRKTYLKELEELDLNIVDLMIGLSLRAANLPKNHYLGTVWRIGWALTESKEKELFEQKAITMMKDPSLDEFNRGLIFMLYSTYTNYLTKESGKQKRDQLRNDIGSFPGFIRAAIAQMKEPKDNE